MAKAGDVDASTAEAVKSGSAETAAQRSCTEPANPAAEATDCTTAETGTTKSAATEPAAAEPASMTTGEPTPSVTATTSSVTTTAPSVATATAATPACKGINRSKGECSTDRGGDGNSDDCFSKHGKFPLWNDLPDRNNLVAATEQRLNVNITTGQIRKRWRSREKYRAVRAKRFTASRMIRPALRRRLQPGACDGNTRVAVQPIMRES